MFKYIQKLFKNKSNETTAQNIHETTDITTLFGTEGTEEVVSTSPNDLNDTTKWVPNDELISKYNALTREITKLPSLQLKLMEFDAYNKRKTQEYELLSNRTSQTIYDRLRLVDLKEDLLKNISDSNIIKGKIAAIEKMEMNNSVIDEYEQYVKSAHTYIVKNNLQNMLSYVDIIDSQSLMIVVKKNLDTIIVSSSEDLQDYALHNLALLDKYFNMKDSIKLRNDKATRYRLKQEELKKIEMVDIVNESDKIVFPGAGLLLGLPPDQSANLLTNEDTSDNHAPALLK
jgi:hypothetical protein